MTLVESFPTTTSTAKNTKISPRTTYVQKMELIEATTSGHWEDARQHIEWEEILLTPDTLLSSFAPAATSGSIKAHQPPLTASTALQYSGAFPSSPSPLGSSSVAAPPTIPTEKIDILELLARKDSVQQLASVKEAVIAAPSLPTWEESLKKPSNNSKKAKDLKKSKSPNDVTKKTQAADTNKSPNRDDDLKKFPPTSNNKKEAERGPSSRANSKTTAAPSSPFSNGANSTPTKQAPNHSTPTKQAAAERFAGAAFSNSPAPSTLPLPSFAFGQGLPIAEPEKDKQVEREPQVQANKPQQHQQRIQQQAKPPTSFSSPSPRATANHKPQQVKGQEQRGSHQERAKSQPKARRNTRSPPLKNQSNSAKPPRRVLSKSHSSLQDPTQQSIPSNPQLDLLSNHLKQMLKIQ